MFPETPQIKISPVTINHSVSLPNEEKPEKEKKKNSGENEMVIHLFGSQFSLAFHGHIEFANLIENRWYNLAGTVHHIVQSVTYAFPDDD